MVKEKECPNCGSSFETYESRDQKFCSRGCVNEYRRTEKECSLDSCNNIFNRKSGKYCSRECYYESKRKPDSEKGNGFVCEICGEEFRANQNNAVTCSWECKNKLQSKKLSKEKVALTCENCGEEFKVKPGSTDRKYCSLECSRTDREYGKEKIQCLGCGEEIEVRENSSRKYCSRKCFGDNGDHIGNLPEEYTNPDELVRTCRSCDEKFETTEGEDKVYCDWDCYLDDQGKESEFEVCQNPECSNNLSGKYQKKYCCTDCAYRHRAVKSKVEIECDWCGAEFERKRFNVKEENNFCSTECYYVYKNEEDVLDYYKDNNPNWKGGYSLKFGSNWAEQRRKCLKRDNYSCVLCGRGKSELGQNPAVHHIKPRRSFENIENANRLDNLVTLCQHHHMVVEGWNLIPSNSDVDLKKLEA